MTTEVFREVFPAFAHQPAEAQFTWFEVVLHATGEASVLADLAEKLRAAVEGDLHVSVSPRYWTLRPSARGEPQVFQSLSVTARDLTPYRKGEEPAQLTEMKKILENLGVRPVESVP